MNTKIKLLIIVALVIVSAGVSGAFFSTYFLVSPVFVKLRNPVIKRTSAQEYAQREAQMIKEASQWILDYQQDKTMRINFSQDIRNSMDK